MPEKLPLLPGFIATLDHLIYDPKRVGPSEKPHLFIYHITIHNQSKLPITIKGRKWVVREQSGEVMVLEGDGVVGEFPRLEPGETFSYHSCHTVATPAMATGAYLAVTDAGEIVGTPIAPFLLIPE